MKRSGWTKWEGDRLIREMQNAHTQSAMDAAHVVLEQAKNQVPHDEGTLQRSGMVIPVSDGKRLGFAITFGGGPGTGHPIVPYAVRWHEKRANFQKGRKHRYLVDPFNRYAATAYQQSFQLRGKGLL